MEQISAVLRNVVNGYAHWCPGCNEMHTIQTKAPQENGAQWSFDDNLEAPTFSPSVRIQSYGGSKGLTVIKCCHYFIKAGRIEFCGDSTHKLAGQTVSLSALPVEVQD